MNEYPDIPAAIDVVSSVPHLRAHARLLCNDNARADDLVERALHIAIAEADQFEPSMSVQDWLLNIIDNEYRALNENA